MKALEFGGKEAGGGRQVALSSLNCLQQSSIVFIMKSQLFVSSWKLLFYSCAFVRSTFLERNTLNFVVSLLQNHHWLLHPLRIQFCLSLMFIAYYDLVEFQLSSSSPAVFYVHCVPAGTECCHHLVLPNGFVTLQLTHILPFPQGLPCWSMILLTLILNACDIFFLT